MKKLFAVLALISIMFMISCSGGGGGNNDTGTDTNTDGSTNADDSISFEAKTDGTTGNTPSGDASISIPAGALSALTTITITQVAGIEFPQHLSNVYEFGPSGSIFNVPVTISLKYDPSLLPEGISASEVTIAYENNDELIDIPTKEIDTVNKIIKAESNHFSNFTVKQKYPSDGYGSENGGYNGIFSMSNKGGSRTYDFLGWEYECVEYVNRYYHEIYDYPSWKGKGDAADYFVNIPNTYKDITAYNNGGSKRPTPGDIIVWEKSNLNGNHGHVAIIREVNSDNVKVIQQNVKQSAADAKFSLPMSSSHGEYTISNNQSNNMGKILGWLHPSIEPNKVVIADDSVGALYYTNNEDNNVASAGYYYDEHVDSGPKEVVGKGYLNGYYYGPTVDERKLGNPNHKFCFQFLRINYKKVDIFTFVPKVSISKSKKASYKLSYVGSDFEIIKSKTIDQSSVNDQWVNLFRDVDTSEHNNFNICIDNYTGENGKHIIYDAIKIVSYPW